MQHSLEFYFLANFLLDTVVIGVIARANSCAGGRRILLCGLLSAVYAVIAKAVFPQLDHPLIQLILLALIGLLISAEEQPRRWLWISFQLLCGTMLLGGIGTAASAKGSRLAAVLACGAAAVYFLLNLRKQRMISWDVSVHIFLNGRSIGLRALIDTGNRLREPLSGLPVLIVEEARLRALFDSVPEPKWRHVSFGGLGGSGTIRCFLPDAIFLRRGSRFIRAPETWVAIYPGSIPGAFHALAPPIFAVIPGNCENIHQTDPLQKGDFL